MSILVPLIQQEFRRRLFEESYVRIENCLSKLTYQQIWLSPNDNTNSIGNLVLHLLGNVRQYICSGIGGQKDVRERNQEFLSTSACKIEKLLSGLALLKEDVLPIIDSLTENILTKEYTVQGFDERGVNIIIHVIEHFSYHVGQIAQQTKLLIDEDLGFYSGLDLDVKSN